MKKIMAKRKTIAGATVLSSSEVPVRYCTYIPIADAAAVGDAAAFELLLLLNLLMLLLALLLLLASLLPVSNPVRLDPYVTSAPPPPGQIPYVRRSVSPSAK